MEHLFRMPLWDATAIAQGATLTSPTIDQSLLMTIEGIEIKATAVAENADVKLEWAEVDDDDDVSGFDTHTDLIASTGALTNPEQTHAVAITGIVSRRFQLRVTELSGTNDATLVTAALICREVT